MIVDDLKFGWRQLIKAPGFAITAVLTLGLAIGANSAGLSLGEAAEWCGGTVSVREATRLRRLARGPQTDETADQGATHDGARGALAAGGGGRAPAGFSAG